MWIQIENHISEITGENFQIKHRNSISGGCINQGYAIADNKRRYFVKINQASQVEMFAAEALGLEQISASNTMRVPKFICWGTTENYGYIVLEYLDLGGRGNWEQLGRNLAKLHRYNPVNQGFGWEINNTIGSTPQINNWTSNWGKFFAKYRIGYQLQLAKCKNGHFPHAQELLNIIPELLANHDPQPSLVHGDLWGGNAGFTTAGEPVIFDPATYIGDREVDLAMTELFGGFPDTFYRGYQDIFPLDPGYEKRKILYNLYHILNHFNLFGGSYESQANRMIKEIREWGIGNGKWEVRSGK